VQQGQDEQDVHQQADQNADPALFLLDVDVFPVQRVEQRRAGAARRTVHAAVGDEGVGRSMKATGLAQEVTLLRRSGYGYDHLPMPR